MATANRHIYIQSENTNLMELSLYSWPPVYFVSIQLICSCWMKNNFRYLFGWIQISQTGSQLYSDTSPSGEFSLIQSRALPTSR